MTDFYAQLEQQLLVAGQRRAAQGRARRALAGHRHHLLVAVALLAALAAGALTLPHALAPSTEPAAPAPAPASGVLAGILVEVQNATTATGAARDVADELDARGARIVAISNATDQGLPRTVVLYRPAAEERARRVAHALGALALRSTSLGAHVSDRAELVVLVGADRVPPRERPRGAVPSTTVPATTVPTTTVPSTTVPTTTIPVPAGAP